MRLMRFRSFYFLLSALVIMPGLISLFLFGLRPAVDFTGGSALVLRFAQEDNLLLPLEETVTEIYDFDQIQQQNSRDYLLRGAELSNQEKDALLAQLSDTFGPVEVLSFESLGPTIGAELLTKTIWAIVIVALIITLYIWRQFNQLKFGLSAVLAMFHDSLVLLGVFSVLGHFAAVEVDVLFVTAMLTTLSFSVHDTIVVYDRIRELRKKHPAASLETVADAAVGETLSRSLNNSITIILVLLALVLLGGETIHYFALALLIGAITGTYSSTFTAVPLLLIWPEKK